MPDTLDSKAVKRSRRTRRPKKQRNANTSRAVSQEQSDVQKILADELAFIIHLAVDVCGYTKLTALHISWFKELLISPRLLFLAPRGHYKSTCITVVYVLYRIIRDPSVRIMIVNEIGENAKGFLREIKAHLQSETFKQEYGSFDQDAARWSEIAITVRSARRSKDPTVAIASTLGTIVSRHCDLIIVDDPISIKNSQTPQQRAKISRWFRETLTPILDPGGQMIVTGTRWHFDDLYGEILDPKQFKSWRKIVLRAEWQENDPDTGEVCTRYLFPEQFNAKELADRRADMGEAFYESQYNNNPSKLEGQRFKFDWLKFYETEPATMRIFQGVDLAISKRDSAAFFAVVTIGIPPEGDIYVLDYVREHLDFPQQCKMMKSQWRLHKPVMCGIEAVSYQEALPQFLRADPEARRMPFDSFNTTSDKVGRIASMSPLFEAGVIRVREDQFELIDEYLSFSRSGTWDLLDALFFAIETSRDQEVEPNIEEISL